MTLLFTSIESVQSARATEIDSRKIPEVGPNKTFIMPSVAASFVQDGNFIEIDASGFYDCDVAVWQASNITTRRVNGRPNLRAQGNSAQGKALWIIKGDNATVENIEISGVKVSDKNGAAIIQEGTNLTTRATN